MALAGLSDAMKHGIGKYILGGVLLLGVGGLMLADAGGVFNRTGSISQGSVARVGPIEISSQEFQRSVQVSLRQNRIPADLAYETGVIEEILQREINTTLLVLAAHDLGIRISDAEVAAYTSDLLAPNVSEELNASQVLQRYLQQSGLTEEMLTRRVRQELAFQILRDSLDAGMRVPETLASDIVRARSEKRTIEALWLRPEHLSDKLDPDEEALKTFYQTRQQRYMTPERRAVAMVVIGPEDVKGETKIQEAELQALYESEKDRFAIGPQRRITQAVFEDLKTAENAAESVKQKGDAALLEHVEKAVDAEGPQAATYLGAESYEREGMPSPLGQEAFRAEPGAVVGPLKTALGWHVMIVEEEIPAGIEPFAEARNVLERETLQERRAEATFALANSLDARLAEGRNFIKAAEALELDPVTAEPLSREALGEHEALQKDIYPVPAVRDLVAETFDIPEGETAPFLPLGSDHLAFVKVREVVEPAPKPFDAVQGQVKQDYLAEKKDELLRQRAQDLVQALEKGEAPEQAAENSGAEIKRFENVPENPEGRSAADLPAPLTSSAHRRIFAVAELEKPVLAPVENGYLIARTLDVKFQEPEQIPKNKLDMTSLGMEQGWRESVLQQFALAQRERYKIRINRSRLHEIYGTKPGEGGS